LSVWSKFAISTGEDIFLEMSAIASGLSFSASETGIESASGNTNSSVFFDVFLQEMHNTTQIIIRIALPFIQAVYLG
jgi:hypothetical protein